MTPYRYQEATDLCLQCRAPAGFRCHRCRGPSCPAHRPASSELCTDCEDTVTALVERAVAAQDEPSYELYAVALCIFGLPLAALVLPMDIALSLLCGLAAVMAPVMPPVMRTIRDRRIERISREMRTRLIERGA